MSTDDKPSCLDCPSYLVPLDAAGHFRKSTGSPMCARFGKVLGKPGQGPREGRAVAVAQATGCSGYMKSRPSKPEAELFDVVLPDPTARIETPPLDHLKTLVNSCAQCKNFVPDETVATELGWTTGLCAAKGKLILADRKAAEAKGCAFRQAGPNRESTHGLLLLPALSDPGSSFHTPMDKFLRDGDSLIEPLDYPSDRDLTSEDKENGIRAWRRLVDPEGTGNEVFIPVFEPSAFTEDDRKLIPQTGDDEHPELYFDHNGAVYRIAVLWMELDETPAAWGMPGVGKTEVGRHLAWMMQAPFYRFSIKESTELHELEGSKEYSPETGTYFREGRLVKAWANKAVIVVDEPNMGRPEVWAFLRPLTDNSKALVLDSDDGRTVARNDFAFLILAMNPAWSPLNVGVAPIGAADASRLMHIEFGLPEERIERDIIKNRVRLDGWEIDRARLDLVMSVSGKVRELCADESLTMSWGIRENIKVARALRFFDPVTAYRMAAADYLEPNQRQSVLDQVRASMGGALPPIKKVDA